MAMVTACQGTAAIIWGLGLLVNRFVYKVEKMVKPLTSPKFWMQCVPYSVGYFLVYYLCYSALAYLSSATFVGIMMGRMYVDLALEYILMNVSSSISKVLQCCMIVACVFVHVGTVPVDKASADPTLGSMIAVAYAFVSALTYAYIPWLCRDSAVPTLSLAFVTSFQQACGGLVVYSITRRGIASFAVAFGNYSSWLVVLASFSLDGACLFCLMSLPPLVITLAGGAAQIPLMIIFETVIIGSRPSFAYIVTAFLVMFAVLIFVYEQNVPRRTDPEEGPISLLTSSLEYARTP